MVNLDSLGLSPTKVDLDRADKKLADALKAVAGSSNFPLSVMNVRGLGRSDSLPQLIPS